MSIRIANSYFSGPVAQHGQQAQPFTCKSPPLLSPCESLSWKLQQTLHRLGYSHHSWMYCTVRCGTGNVNCDGGIFLLLVRVPYRYESVSQSVITRIQTRYRTRTRTSQSVSHYTHPNKPGMIGPEGKSLGVAVVRVRVYIVSLYVSDYPIHFSTPSDTLTLQHTLTHFSTAQYETRYEVQYEQEVRSIATTVLVLVLVLVR